VAHLDRWVGFVATPLDEQKAALHVISLARGRGSEVKYQFF